MFPKTKQKVSESNYLRKRNLTDLLINLKMTYNSIKLLVNSFTKPYEGSILIIQDKILRVSRITEIKNKGMGNIEIGKILKIDQSYVVTRCQDAIIKINFYSKYRYRKNKISYIYDPLYYILKSKKLFMKISNLLDKNK